LLIRQLAAQRALPLARHRAVLGEPSLVEVLEVPAARPMAA
jgi:hypothetical protein